MMHQNAAVVRLEDNRESPLDPSTVFNILRALDICTTPDSIRDVLLASLVPFGFKGFTLTTDRRMKSLFVHVQVLVTWPTDANSYFMADNRLNHDPVIRRWHRATEPFVWDLSIYDPACREQEQLLALRRRLGVTGGVCIPVHKIFGGRTTLFISGSGFPSDGETVLALTG